MIGVASCALDAVVVLGEDAGVERVVVLADLEGVGEDDAVERAAYVAASGSARRVVGGLDVDGGDVVGEQQDLVGVQLAGVLAGQVVRLDQAGLEQPDDEGAGAGEGVEDVDALVGEALAELGWRSTSSAERRMKSTISTGV